MPFIHSGFGLGTFALFELLASSGWVRFGTISLPLTITSYVVARFQNLSNPSNGVGAEYL
jgi:hypothetical protein